MPFFKIYRQFCLLSCLGLFSSLSSAANLSPLTMCVFDFIGNGGPVHKAMEEFKIDAARWGVDLSF